MKALDNTVHGMGVHLLRIPWNPLIKKMGTESLDGRDADFLNTLASQAMGLRGNDRVLIVADSTVDHQNWKSLSGERKGSLPTNFASMRHFRATCPPHICTWSPMPVQGIQHRERGNTLLDLLEKGLRCCNPAVIVLGVRILEAMHTKSLSSVCGTESDIT